MSNEFTTAGGIVVERQTETIDGGVAVEALIDSLDSHKGVLFTSTYEYPGRYTRWDMGFVDPPLEIVATGRHVTIRSLNERGHILLTPIAECVEGTVVDDVIELTVPEPEQ